MTPQRLVLALLISLVAACSGSSGSSPNNLLTAVQDLGVDPSGQTTVLTFARNAPMALTPGNFVADGGQLATNVTVNGAEVTVTWDDRVTPSHQVRPTGLGSLSGAFVSVSTTVTAAPTFTITAATQVAGLGNDTITVQFSGAQVVESSVENEANWVLEVNGTALDLTGSTFDLDTVTQILTITLGTLANLHASFDLNPTSDVMSVADVPLAQTAVTGAATGDTTAPTLMSSEQNLTENEFGFVVDFTFSEAMDPVFSTGVGNFGVDFSTIAVDVEQISETVLRVTFNAPVIPGLDMVELASLVDAHGNELGDMTVAITTTPVVNSFDGNPSLTTVPNAGGDTVQALFTQAIDPETAEDFDLWRLESPSGNAIDLSNSDFSYDLLTKTLTITLDTDLITGDDFVFGAAASAPFPLDVDGDDFTTLFGPGTVAGDATAPSATNVLQNRQIDDLGLTYDVYLSEDVDPVQAQMTANYTFSGGATVDTATLLANQDVVRLEIDALELPGAETLSVQNLVDLAGNAMGSQTGIAIGSSDTVDPQASMAEAYADTGIDNDTLTVLFDDRMIEADVEDPLNWVVESPLGSAVDTTNATVTYAASTGEAVLVFDGGDGINLKRGEDFSVDFQNLTDVSGNALGSSALTGSVAAETTPPALESVWVDALSSNSLHVRFDEPCDLFDDAQTLYVIRDAMGTDIGGGTPTIVVDGDLRGASLTFATGADPALHVLEARGVTDLAGNQMFAVEDFAISMEDKLPPALEAASQVHLAVSGENNDELTVVFDRSVSTWGLFDIANWDLTNGVDNANFATAQFDFDGDRTVTVTFGGPSGYNFDATADTLTVDNLFSVQGVEMSSSSAEMTAADAGTDATAPLYGTGGVRIDPQDPSNSVLIEMDEALDTAEAANTANFSHAGLGNPDSATLLGPRTVRATWAAGGLVAGVLVDVTAPDLAQNAGLASLAIQAADGTGPVPDHVEGVIVPGVGGDLISVRFNEPVNTFAALQEGSYDITLDGESLDISGSTFRYDGNTNTVFIRLPSDVNLQASSLLTVDVIGVTNHAGIDFPGSRNGVMVGDMDAPDFSLAFTNYRADVTGVVVDVLFTEDVNMDFAGLPVNYSVSGGQTVIGAEVRSANIVRLTLSAPLTSGDMVETVSLPDLAGNVSGTIFIEPIL